MKSNIRKWLLLTTTTKTTTTKTTTTTTTTLKYAGGERGVSNPGNPEIRKFLHVKSGCPETSFRSELLNPEPRN